MSDDIFWAIEGPHGLYCGTKRTRVDAIVEHVHGRWRWTESAIAWGGKLAPMQRADWNKAKREGDRAVRVRVTVIPQAPGAPT